MPATLKRRTKQVAAELGGNVRRSRSERTWTQEQLAEAAGLDLSHTQRVERGQVNVTLDTIVRLADALGVAPAALLKPGRAVTVKRGRPRRVGPN